MPQKTKTQLRDELEQAKKELVEVQAKTRAEMAAAKETERKLQESERQLKQEMAELRRRATDSERELNEATAELSIAQDKVEDLEASLCEGRSRSLAGATAEGGPDDLEVGSLIRDLEDARDDAFEALDRSQWEMDRMKRDFEISIVESRESMREELELKYKRDIKTRDELIELLKAKCLRVLKHNAVVSTRSPS